MITERFDEILARRLTKIREILIAKGAEYSVQLDRLHNFRRAASMLGGSPEQALVGMWAKHLVSVLDMVDSIDSGTTPSRALVDEKLGDTINYAILLEALITDRIDKQPTKSSARHLRRDI